MTNQRNTLPKITLTFLADMTQRAEFFAWQVGQMMSMANTHNRPCFDGNRLALQISTRQAANIPDLGASNRTCWPAEAELVAQDVMTYYRDSSR